MVYYIPNPKTGRNVKVTFTHVYKDATVEKWAVHAVDVKGPRAGFADGSLRIRASSEHASLDSSAGSHPRGGGYGLAMYLAAAMFARLQGVQGLRSTDRTLYSTQLWEKLHEHGLAECSADTGMFTYNTICEMDGKAVEHFLRRNGWKP